MSDPTTIEYLAASQAAYTGSVVPGLSPLLQSDGAVFAKEIDADGFYAVAYVTTDGNVIIAYRGTVFDLTSPYGRGSILADSEIFLQNRPQAYLDAQNFFLAVQARVAQIAEERGSAPAPIYVTGHSLGGAEAEYVALQNNFTVGGAAFGAPGIAQYTNSSPPANFVSYVAYGDPVANYASDVRGETGFAPTTGMDHVTSGLSPVLVGVPANAANLALASLAFNANLPPLVPDSLPTGLKLALWPSGIPFVGIGLLGNIGNHDLAGYAFGLGLSVPGLSASGYTVQTLIDLLAGLDAPLGEAGRQDFEQATFSSTLTQLTSKNFQITLDVDGGTVVIDQRRLLQNGDIVANTGEFRYDLNQSFNETQSGTFIDEIDGNLMHLVFSSLNGVETRSVVDYINGTSSSTKYGYTIGSDSFYTTNFYSGRDETGDIIGTAVSESDGISRISFNGSDGSSATILFRGPGSDNNPIAQAVVTDPDFTGVTITYGADGSSALSYMGPAIPLPPPNTATVHFAQNINADPTFTRNGRLTQSSDNSWTLDLGSVSVRDIQTELPTSTQIDVVSNYDGPNPLEDFFSVTGTLTVHTLNTGGSGFFSTGSFSLGTGPGLIAFNGITVDEFTPGFHVGIVTFKGFAHNFAGDEVPLPEIALTVTEEVTAVCFCAGTCIATPLGKVCVESLSVGDEVITASGKTRPIIWIGTGRVLARRGRRNAATPVIVRRGALADGVPHCDLRVTKGHSLYIDGALIPVEELVNHRSILWDDHAQEVELYHIELEAHDVLLANGAPAESYRDDGNRWLFRNANSSWGGLPKEPCAPVLTDGPFVDAVWRKLLERAGPRPRLPLTDDPDLHLLVDGVRVDVALRTDMKLLFRLAAPPVTVRIVSCSAVPQELGLARDPRQLGVALRQIMVTEAARVRVMDAENEKLTDGFHAFEPKDNFRWTDGDALLPAELFDDLTGPLDVTLHIACLASYVDTGLAQRVA